VHANKIGTLKTVCVVASYMTNLPGKIRIAQANEALFVLIEEVVSFRT
jgi:hypothetical protein